MSGDLLPPVLLPPSQPYSIHRGQANARCRFKWVIALLGTERREFHFGPEESDFVIFRLPGRTREENWEHSPPLPGQLARPAGRPTDEKGAVIPNEDGDWEALRMLFLESRPSVPSSPRPLCVPGRDQISHGADPRLPPELGKTSWQTFPGKCETKTALSARRASCPRMTSSPPNRGGMFER